MSKLAATRNNPDPVEFKKEPKENEIEIIEHTTDGHFNSIHIPFKTESNNNNNNNLTSNTFDCFVLNERIKQLESENKSLLKTIEEQSSEISGLKLKLNKYEAICENNQSEEEPSNLEPESTFDSDNEMSINESYTDSEATPNKVINIILILILMIIIQNKFLIMIYFLGT